MDPVGSERLVEYADSYKTSSAGEEKANRTCHTQQSQKTGNCFGRKLERQSALGRQKMRKLTELQLRERWQTNAGKNVKRKVLKRLHARADWSEPLSGFLGTDEIEHCTDLRGIDLSNTSLPGVDLSYCSLDFACFNYCQMNCSTLHGVSIHQTSFVGTNLACSTLVGAAGKKANFSNADLYRVYGMGSAITGSLFRNAHLRRSDFSGAKLTNCDFSEADLRDIDFESADLTGCDFSSALLEEQ